ncbi:prepilin-type N-terminal cleavage/methylation domain-containing protein [Clostridium algidicarnis]|uniref:Type IV pilus assembly protein PilA n=1 Tax=Clostridium algidicarnis DSM 15099 TaxID=1121295 RepID=A0A2S6FZ54_9CLOT|nr:prepilin-type N-terminal cleavage/methylation domain-containing protein [Clostridium algidicarnis]PPK48734.1 type IV pilus assembly protein PilA [Clostridium algidicarnis DSM 15099]
MKELLTKERKKKKGFTLIELIIVLAIIAIIAAIAIPNFTKVRADSKVKADTQSAETIRRITLTKLASGDIKLDGEKALKITVTPQEDKPVKIEPAAEGLTAEDFKEVKKPQQDGVEAYIIDIDKDGNVTVTVGTKVVK